MTTFNGFNGTILLNTGVDELHVGTIPGADFGYTHRLPVTVSIRIEREERRETYETTEHEHVTAPLSLSITTSVWSPGRADMLAGGATRDPLRDVATHGEPARFWDADTLVRLADLGDAWHLNTMQAACAHQTPVGDTTGERLDQTPPCTVTGYRYGSQWLVDPLTDAALAMLLALLSGPISNHNVYVHDTLNGYLR